MRFYLILGFIVSSACISIGLSQDIEEDAILLDLTELGDYAEHDLRKRQTVEAEVKSDSAAAPTASETLSPGTTPDKKKRRKKKKRTTSKGDLVDMRSVDGTTNEGPKAEGDEKEKRAAEASKAESVSSASEAGASSASSAVASLSADQPQAISETAQTSLLTSDAQSPQEVDKRASEAGAQTPMLVADLESASPLTSADSQATRVVEKRSHFGGEETEAIIEKIYEEEKDMKKLMRTIVKEERKMERMLGKLERIEKRIEAKEKGKHHRRQRFDE